MRRALPLLLFAAACASGPVPEGLMPFQRQGLPPALPDAGWGLHVLELAEAPGHSIWAGTYGNGIFVLHRDSARWRQFVPDDADTTSISWGFVNSIAFEGDSAVWYGTIGNGFGRSTDDGLTWRNWTFDQLGPEWQYVAPHGIATRADTVYIATADGLRITWDGGDTWRCIKDVAAVTGGARVNDGCTETIRGLPTEYLLSIDVGTDGTIRVGHLNGLTVSRDGGRTWRALGPADGVPAERIRSVVENTDSTIWFATESTVYVDSTGAGHFAEAQLRLPGFRSLPGAPRQLVPSPAPLPPSIATSYGMAAQGSVFEGFRLYYLAAGDVYRPAADVWDVLWWGPPWWPIGGSRIGLARVLAGDRGPADSPEALRAPRSDAPAQPRHAWFARPIDPDTGNPYIDGTYRYGSTMGGNFQQHQGVEFNNPAGMPVLAAGPGVVVYAGEAEAGALTVAIKHDRDWEGQQVFTVYYHNRALDVTVGQRVQAGDVIARVGNTGRATNDHMHLEVHVAPATADSSAIVNPDERFPPYTVNPQLWLEPMPGTGIVAGRVLDSTGTLVQGARVHGLVLPFPEETPFSFAETYRDRAHSDPAYGENFAVGDVPAGDYLLGVEIEGRPVWRRVRVQPGMLTWVEFRP